MNPQVTFNSSNRDDDNLYFTLSGVNVSLANSLRRTMLSDIPLIVFKTTPYDKNKCTIHTNTSRLNNEIIKLRLSCIPIHFKDVEEFSLKKYVLEVNIENTTDTIMFITTEDFTIKDVETGVYLSKDETQQIFPADKLTGHFIDFVRLRPQISSELPGEKLHLSCGFDIGTSKEDGTFNAVSTCAYGFTIDDAAQIRELSIKQQTWKDEGKNEEEILFEVENWKLLEGKRFYIKDSFDFIIQSVGVYDNMEIVVLSCKILIRTLKELQSTIEKDELEIKVSESTMSNSYDIILENEDYTIGKILEYFMYSKFYESTKELTFCGFKKFHPHDTYSIIRVANATPVEKSSIKGYLLLCIIDAVIIYETIQEIFTRKLRL